MMNTTILMSNSIAITAHSTSIILYETDDANILAILTDWDCANTDVSNLLLLLLLDDDALL